MMFVLVPYRFIAEFADVTMDCQLGALRHRIFLFVYPLIPMKTHTFARQLQHKRTMFKITTKHASNQPCWALCPTGGPVRPLWGTCPSGAHHSTVWGTCPSGPGPCGARAPQGPAPVGHCAQRGPQGPPCWTQCPTGRSEVSFFIVIGPIEM